MAYLAIIATYLFINNFILSKFLGLCPFIGVSKNIDSAIGMGFAVTFVMGMASVATWLVYYFILTPLKITYLDTITFILVIAALVQFVELVIQKTSPPLYKALGIYLPLITTNCAVLGIALIAVQEKYNLIKTFTAGVAGGLGFFLAIVIMSTLREKLERESIPKCLSGIPIAFITAGIMALAFMGFDSALLENLFGG